MVKKTTENTAASSKLESFVAHLKKVDEKLRPKKAAKLKAYLKNWSKKDESLVEPIYNGLLAKGHIEIDGEEVKYFGNTKRNFISE